MVEDVEFGPGMKISSNNFFFLGSPEATCRGAVDFSSNEPFARVYKIFPSVIFFTASIS